jgi:NADP-dependent 3-hydroxy acid dehydrogenase YdfG
MAQGIQDKIIITGASSGLGEAAALPSAGWKRST